MLLLLARLNLMKQNQYKFGECQIIDQIINTAVKTPKIKLRMIKSESN